MRYIREHRAEEKLCQHKMLKAPPAKDDRRLCMSRDQFKGVPSGISVETIRGYAHL